MKGEDDTYVVSMKLPECRKEDVHVELRDEFVAVRAVRRTHPERGRSTQRLARLFRLPVDADREHLEATFDDGTLTLRIHRLDSRPPRSVELR